jgi:hypothetical protein
VTDTFPVSFKNTVYVRVSPHLTCVCGQTSIIQNLTDLPVPKSFILKFLNKIVGLFLTITVMVIVWVCEVIVGDVNTETEITGEP